LPTNIILGSLPDRSITIAAALVLTVVAVLASPISVQGGDAGELATVMLRGGVAHPPGFPWMRTVLAAISRALEGFEIAPARAAALPCALSGVFAWLLVQRMLARSGAAVVGAVVIILVALSPIVVVHVNDSEVWGLHLLLCACVVHFALFGQRVATSRRSQAGFAAGLGVLLGLAMSHHPTAILLLPLVLAAWPIQTHGTFPQVSNRRDNVMIAIMVVAGITVGLTPYLTLALGTAGAWRWGEPQTLDGLWRHVTRADYGVFQLSLHHEQPTVLALWSRASSSIGSTLTAGVLHDPWLCGSFLGVVFVAAKPPVTARKTAFLGLKLAVVAATLAFPAWQNIDPHSPFGAWILERFDLLAILLWIPLLTLAVMRAAAIGTLARGSLAVLGVTVLAAQPLRTWAHGIPAREHGVEGYARDLLATVDRHPLAIVLGSDDHRTFPVLYAQNVLELGPRTLYIDASLLAHGWYRARLRRQWPQLPDVDRPLALIGALWRLPDTRDIPIYLANVFSRPAAEQLDVVPEGILWRVIPPHARRPSLDRLVEAHVAAMAQAHGIALSSHDSPKSAHPWSQDLAHAYIDGHRQLTEACVAAARADLMEIMDLSVRRLRSSQAQP